MKRFSIIVGILVVLGFSFPALAQEPSRGSYPYFLTSDKPFPVGTRVWANMGVSDCSWPADRNWPKADDHCFDKNDFGQYAKGKIARVYSEIWEGMDSNKANPRFVRVRNWWYVIEFEFLIDAGRGPTSTWDAKLDSAFKFVNLPAKYAEWSEYLVRMNSHVGGK